MLERYGAAEGCRFVAVGTPFRGSHAARTIAGLPWGGRLALGESIDYGLLYGGPGRAPDHCRTGVIAGNLSIGISRFLFSLQSPSDGTVAVAETRLEGAEHTQVSKNHISLLFSSKVVRLADNFFRKGSFTHPV